MDIKTNSSVSGSLRVQTKEISISSGNQKARQSSNYNQDASVLSIPKSRNSLESPREAREISNDIAFEIGSPLRSDEDKEILVETSSGNLDPDRVLSLLED